MIPIFIRGMKEIEERRANVQLMLRQIPEAQVVWDLTRNATDTWCNALKTAGDGPAIHMEDDCKLVTRFRSKIEKVIAERPDTLINFFSMRKADKEIGSRWDNKLNGTVCLYFPKGYSAEIYQYSIQWRVRNDNTINKTAIDWMVDEWLKTRKEKYWIHVPNLVDHHPFRSAINPKRGTGRQSKTFTAI